MVCDVFFQNVDDVLSCRGAIKNINQSRCVYGRHVTTTTTMVDLMITATSIVYNRLPEAALSQEDPGRWSSAPQMWTWWSFSSCPRLWNSPLPLLPVEWGRGRDLHHWMMLNHFWMSERKSIAEKCRNCCKFSSPTVLIVLVLNTQLRITLQFISHAPGVYPPSGVTFRLNHRFSNYSKV